MTDRIALIWVLPGFARNACLRGEEEQSLPCSSELFCISVSVHPRVHRDLAPPGVFCRDMRAQTLTYQGIVTSIQVEQNSAVNYAPDGAGQGDGWVRGSPRRRTREASGEYLLPVASAMHAFAG